MKAASIHQHGGPEVLTYEDAPEPTIKANQVLVRVRATALNHLDLFVRAGIPGMKVPMPHVLGSDIVGFQTGEHARSFLDAVETLPDAAVDRANGVVGRPHGTVAVRAYPISVEWPNSRACARARAAEMARSPRWAAATLGKESTSVG